MGSILSTVGSQDFPVVGHRATPPSPSNPLRVAPCSPQQRRRGLALPGGLDRRLQKRPHRTARPRAGRQHRPDPLAPALSGLASRPLRDVAVDHHEADRLFRQVVRRLDPRSGHEPEITLPIKRQPFRQPRPRPPSAARLGSCRSTSAPARLQAAARTPRPTGAPAGGSPRTTRNASRNRSPYAWSRRSGRVVKYFTRRVSDAPRRNCTGTLHSRM